MWYIREEEILTALSSRIDDSKYDYLPRQFCRGFSFDFKTIQVLEGTICCMVCECSEGNECLSK